MAATESLVTMVTLASTVFYLKKYLTRWPAYTLFMDNFHLIAYHHLVIQWEIYPEMAFFQKFQDGRHLTHGYHSNQYKFCIAPEPNLTL